MINKPIRWAILGTSPISEKLAHAIKASAMSELVAIGSRSAITAKQFAHKFGIPTWYDDYHVLLNAAKIDAVYIGLPNHLHKEWSIHCANAGKHILCEKPFVISVVEAEEVMHAVKKNNVICMEALMYRYHPFTQKLLELVQSNILGDIKLMTATYSANISAVANITAGGSIRNLGCYPISLVRLLAQAEPISMFSQGRMHKQNHTDNQASAILKFPNDMMAVVSTMDDINMVYQFDVYGTHGHLHVVTNPWMPNQESNKILIYPDRDKAMEIEVMADKPLYTYQIDSMCDSIRKGEMNANGMSLRDSLNNVMVLENWLAQVKQNEFSRELNVVGMK